MSDGQGAAGAKISRRLALTGAASLLSGCASWPDMPDFPQMPGYRKISDAHTHLFSASDLPVVKFVEHVVLRRAEIDLGEGQAVVDLFLKVIKPLSMSARRERNLRRTLRSHQMEVPVSRFADDAAKRSLEVHGARLTDNTWGEPERQDLAASYDALMLILESADGRKNYGLLGVGPNRETVPVESAFETRVNAFSFAAERAGRGQSVVSDPEAGPLLGILGADRNVVANAIDQTFATIEWGYQVLQARTVHVAKYLQTYQGRFAQPRRLMNFLVDYDSWLSDYPSPGSSHDEQVQLWPEIAEEYSNDVEIHTFAGYCPLKHAIELRTVGEANTQFARLQRAKGQGHIAGLKLYPPMGFKPIGNAAMGDHCFRSDYGIKDEVLTGWRRHAPGVALGPKLDEALHIAYRWCVESNTPVVAHAGPTNDPAPGFDQRANPEYWRDVARAYPDLWIALGHFVFDAKDFTDAMDANQRPADVWALNGSRELLRETNQRGRVFIDIGYTDELLKIPELAVEFFRQLKRYCAGDEHFEGVDPNFTQLLYGTDWIMLGRERGHRVIST